MAILLEQQVKQHPQLQQMQPILIFSIFLLVIQILVLTVDLVFYPFISDDFKLIAFAVLPIYSIVIAYKLNQSRKEREEHALLATYGGDDNEYECEKQELSHIPTLYE
jgi:hypothetical protein